MYVYILDVSMVACGCGVFGIDPDAWMGGQQWKVVAQVRTVATCDRGQLLARDAYMYVWRSR